MVLVRTSNSHKVPLGTPSRRRPYVPGDDYYIVTIVKKRALNTGIDARGIRH